VEEFVIWCDLCKEHKFYSNKKEFLEKESCPRCLLHIVKKGDNEIT